MDTLLQSLDNLKEYVSVNKNIEWDSIQPYIKQADRKFLITAIGTDQYKVFSEDEPAEDVPKEVYQLLREASANLSWFLYLPLANVQVGDEGISVAQGESYKAADWWQIRDLRRSFLDAGFQAIDEALKTMEANEADFEPWTKSSNYTNFTELFVKRTDTFSRWYNIAQSRRTFLALHPYMLEVHHQYFTAQLNEATIAIIQTGEDPVQQQVLQFMQAAQVSYTVAKAVESGTFDLTATGMYQKMEEFPGYKTTLLDQTLLNTLKHERLVAGEEFYKKALTLIEANPELFADFEKKETGVFVQPTNTKSIISF